MATLIDVLNEMLKGRETYMDREGGHTVGSGIVSTIIE